MKRFALLAVVVAVIAAGCAPKTLRKAKDSKGAAGQKAGGADGTFAPGVDVTEASLRGSDFVAVEGLQPILFEYDSSSLSPQALEALKHNAELLKKEKGREILVAGHCDERGTIEYNLALGQRRAKEVREYYIRLGVPGKSIATISYGKESPVCHQSTESCWAKNRRAETRLRAATASSGATKSGQ